MYWWDMPENTELEKVKKEIAECNHALGSLMQCMKDMGIPQKDWGKNVPAQAWIKRLENATAMRDKIYANGGET